MLDIIQNNPYRLLGIYSNSPIRERVANYNKLKAFLRVGKETAFGLDLTALLPAAAHTGEIVSDANTKLALPNDQLHYAQFWFNEINALGQCRHEPPGHKECRHGTVHLEEKGKIPHPCRTGLPVR